MHARPIKPFKQRRQLCGRQAHDAVFDLRPAELPAFEALRNQAHTGAVPEQQLDAIGALRAEHIDDAGEWLELTSAARPSMPLRKSTGFVAIRTRGFVGKIN